MSVSSIEVLPNEILGEIFTLCVDADIDMQSRLDDSYQWYDYPSATLDTTKSPWVLSQVSGRWRSLALSSPALWSSFDINWPEALNVGTDLPDIEFLLSLQLQRCGDQPLSISWYQGSCHKHVLWLLCSKASQWTRVTLRTRKSGFGWLFDYRDRFTNITALHLRFEIRTGEWESVSPLQMEYGHFYGMFRNASNLRQLTLSGDYEVMPHVVSEIPWEQLTHFAGTNIATNSSIEESFFGVLPLLENVETCSLDITSVVGAPSTSFTLPCLHTLALEQVRRSGTVANVLVAPSLRSLNFTMGGPLLDSFQPMLQLFDRSSCHLTHLSFVNISPIDTEEWLEFLRSEQVEGVQTLEVAWDTWACPDVLQAFRFPTTPDDRTKILLPHLQSLVVTDEDSEVFLESSELVDMLASRRDISQVVGSASCLESFTIRGDGSSVMLNDLDTVARFAELQKEGLFYSRVVYL